MGDSYVLGVLVLLLIASVAALAIGHIVDWADALGRYRRVRAEWEAHVSSWGDMLGLGDGRKGIRS